MSSFRQLMMKNKGGGSQIEYLQSDGAIYIPLCESGETLNIKSYKLDVEYLEYAQSLNVAFGRIFSSSGSWNSYGIGMYDKFIGPGQYDGTYFYYFDRYPSVEATTPQLNNRRTEEKSFSSQVTADSNWGLFGGYTQTTGNTLTFTKLKVWSLICYDGNGNEVANLLPKEENGVLGMYDSVRNKFIAGVGSGSFIGG